MGKIKRVARAWQAASGARYTDALRGVRSGLVAVDPDDPGQLESLMTMGLGLLGSPLQPISGRARDVFGYDPLLYMGAGGNITIDATRAPGNLAMTMTRLAAVRYQGIREDRRVIYEYLPTRTPIIGPLVSRRELFAQSLESLESDDSPLTPGEAGFAEMSARTPRSMQQLIAAIIVRWHGHPGETPLYGPLHGTSLVGTAADWELEISGPSGLADAIVDRVTALHMGLFGCVSSPTSTGTVLTYRDASLQVRSMK